MREEHDSGGKLLALVADGLQRREQDRRTGGLGQRHDRLVGPLLAEPAQGGDDILDRGRARMLGREAVGWRKHARAGGGGETGDKLGDARAALGHERAAMNVEQDAARLVLARREPFGGHRRRR